MCIAPQFARGVGCRHGSPSDDTSTGPADYFSGPLKWDERGRRVGAGLVIAQWQGGQPVPVYPASLATSKPVWVGK